MPTVCDYGQNIVGPFKQTLFLGCSVKSFSCNIGWNEQVTTLTVELVEDPCAGPKVYYNHPGHTGSWTAADPGFEAYQPTVGGPVYFRVADFEFAGVVQSWDKSDSTSGLNQYSVSISDPRFILQNTQIILNEYNGGVGELHNVINPFGWLEAHGFGSSAVNDQGVPWLNMKLAVSTLLSGAFDTNFGPYGSITFRTHDWNGVNILGEKFGLIRDRNPDTGDRYAPSLKTTFGGNGWYTGYFLDMDDIPFAPTIYRLGADNMSAMDIITQVCEDAGCDYHIEMFITSTKQKVIKVRAQERRAQPVMGRIQEFIDTRDNVMSKKVGRELRNEPTSSLAVGANVQDFYSTSAYTPWWGFDEDGNKITYNTLSDADGDPIPAIFGDIYNVYMDFRKINTTLGSPLANRVYVNELEMRAALSGIDDWYAYIMSYNNFGRTTTGQWLRARSARLTLEMIENDKQDEPAAGVNMGAGAMAGGAGFNFVRLDDVNLLESDKVKVHGFITAFASEFYGKKVLVTTDAESYYDDESQKRYYSKAPSSEAWVEDQDTWLGLTKPSVYLDQFTNDTGMVSGGAKYVAADGFVKEGQRDIVSDGTSLYIKAQADTEYLGDGTQSVVVTLGTAVEAGVQESGMADDYAGYILVGLNLNRTLADLKVVVGKGLNMGGGDVAFGLAKKRLYPDSLTIPMRSNYSKYGPFPYQGPPGPVNMKPDGDLSPWNYGGSAMMSIVADSQNKDGLTFMQEGERGSINWPGYPEHRIGAELRSDNFKFQTYSLTQYPWSVGGANYYYLYLPVAKSVGDFGPNITSVAVNVSDAGVNTTYSLTTFTPSFGRLAKLNTERLKQAARNRVSQAKQRRKMAFLDMYVQRSRFQGA